MVLMDYIYIQHLPTLIIKPYDDVTEFFDFDELGKCMLAEEKATFISYGSNSTHRVVSKKVYDNSEEIPAQG
jgi:hypothetical protein